MKVFLNVVIPIHVMSDAWSLDAGTENKEIGDQEARCSLSTKFEGLP